MSVNMDCYVAPLRIVKKTNPSSRLQESTAEKHDPLPAVPKRSSSITSDAWFSSISTPTEVSFEVSSSPPFDGRQICLDVPKVRKDGGEKSHSWSEMKKGQQDDPVLASSEEAPYLTDDHLEAGSHDDDQVTNNTPGQRTPHKLFHFLHIFDKRFSSLPSHDLSKRTSQSDSPVNRSYQTLRSDFTMQNCPTPLTILKMDLASERVVKSSKHTDVHVRITISADVDLASESFTHFGNYTDNVVLLNIKSKTEIEKVIGMAQVVIDTLKPGDSLLIACVNLEKTGRIDILMPLCQGPNVDLKRLASGHSSVGRPLWKGTSDGNILSDAIHTVSEMLTCASRVRHVFLVSINCDSAVQIKGNPVVGLSTVTTSDSHDIGFSARLGWHIRCELTTNNTLDTSSLRPKVEKSIQLIRSGLAPGNIGNLRLELLPGIGCTILSHGKLTVDSLRPGESCYLFARVKASKASRIDRLEEGIKSLLHCSDVDEDQDGAILMAKLSFKHSLLPFCSSVLRKSCHILEK